MFKSWIEIDAWPWHGGLKNKQAKWLPLFKLSTLRPGWFIHLAWNLAKINERKSFSVFLSSSFPLFFFFLFSSSSSFNFLFFLFPLFSNLNLAAREIWREFKKILARVKFLPVPMNEPRSSLNGCRWLNRHKFAILRLYSLCWKELLSPQTKRTCFNLKIAFQYFFHFKTSLKHYNRVFFSVIKLL